MITWENYEEYIMMHADGELTPAEENALMAFVNEHPELKKELAAYELTRMTPDTTQVFANKDELLKPLPAKRIIAFPVWLKYSIAAGIAAIIVTSLFMYTSSDNNTIAISRVDTVKKEITSQPAAPVVAGVQDNKIQASHQDTVTKGQHATIAVALVTVPKIRKHQSVNSSYPAPGIAINKPGNDIVAGPVVNALPLATTKQIIADKKITPVAEEKEVPAFAAQSTDEAPKKTFWDKVPLNDIKKQQLENLAGAIAGAYEQVNDAKQTIEDKKLTVRVEKRKLMISF